MKLWVFGCSFSIGSNFKHPNLWQYDKNWIDIVYEDLKFDQVANFAQFGVSNEFIFKNVVEQSVKYSAGDVIIIQLTSPIRKWFFPDDPVLSNFTNTKPEAFPNDSYKAIKSYLTHLQNPQCDDIIYSAYVYAIEHIKSVRSDCNFVILPGWGDYPRVLGNLSEICDGEFDNKENCKNFYEEHSWDPRLNHFSEENHTVLGEKILEYIKSDDLEKVLDLENGFTKSLYNKEYIGEDKKYCT